MAYFCIEITPDEYILQLEISVYDGRVCKRVQIGHPGRYLRRHLDFQRYWQMNFSYTIHKLNCGHDREYVCV